MQLTAGKDVIQKNAGEACVPEQDMLPKVTGHWLAVVLIQGSAPAGGIELLTQAEHASLSGS